MQTDAILRLSDFAAQRHRADESAAGRGAGGANLTMRVAGAIDDQNTVTLDGSISRSRSSRATLRCPLRPDSVEEFRVTVLTPNSSLVRASGAQVTLVGRTGGNEFHGALYEYLQNSVLNSNTWDNNRGRPAQGADSRQPLRRPLRRTDQEEQDVHLRAISRSARFQRRPDHAHRSHRHPEAGNPPIPRRRAETSSSSIWRTRPSAARTAAPCAIRAVWE